MSISDTIRSKMKAKAERALGNLPYRIHEERRGISIQGRLASEFVGVTDCKELGKTVNEILQKERLLEEIVRSAEKNDDFRISLSPTEARVISVHGGAEIVFSRGFVWFPDNRSQEVTPSWMADMADAIKGGGHEPEPEPEPERGSFSAEELHEAARFLCDHGSASLPDSVRQEDIRPFLDHLLPEDKVVREVQHQGGRVFLEVVPRFPPDTAYDKEVDGTWVHVNNRLTIGWLKKHGLKEYIRQFYGFRDVCVTQPVDAQVTTARVPIAFLLRGKVEYLFDYDVHSSRDPWTGRNFMPPGAPLSEGKSEGWLNPSMSKIIAVITPHDWVAEQAESLGFKVYRNLESFDSHWKTRASLVLETLGTDRPDFGESFETFRVEPRRPLFGRDRRRRGSFLRHLPRLTEWMEEHGIQLPALDMLNPDYGIIMAVPDSAPDPLGDPALKEDRKKVRIVPARLPTINEYFLKGQLSSKDVAMVRAKGEPIRNDGRKVLTTPKGYKILCSLRPSWCGRSPVERVASLAQFMDNAGMYEIANAIDRLVDAMAEAQA